MDLALDSSISFVARALFSSKLLRQKYIFREQGAPPDGFVRAASEGANTICQTVSNHRGVRMLWTEEAVETLKRLALEGMSASVIAAALGAESRNAVIGKANRIGIQLNGGRASASGAPRPVTKAAGKPAPAAPHSPSGRAWAFAEAEVGPMRRVPFKDIRAFACRWPVGDPRSGDFAYCGLAPAEGRPYCAGHCRMAYRPPSARATRNPHERRWSSPVANAWRPTSARP